MSRMFEDLKETLKQEIRTLSKKEMTKDSLDTLYKLAESLKAVQTIEAMEKSEGGSSSEQGYSRYMPMGSYNMSMNRGSYEGGSNRGSYDNGGSNRGSYDGSSNRGSYEGGNSNRGSYDSYDGGSYGSYARRGRDGDGDGRYNEASGRNYSRHSAKEKMIQKLTMMMDEASTDKEREAIMRCMEQLES